MLFPTWKLIFSAVSDSTGMHHNFHSISSLKDKFDVCEFVYDGRAKKSNENSR